MIEKLSKVRHFLSEIILRNSVILNNKLGFTAFQKKPEFGPANIEVKRDGAEQGGQLYLLDKGSTLMLVYKENELY